MDTRLTALEERYTLMERTVSDLSEVVWEQTRAIDRLQRRLVELEQRQRSMGDGGAPIPDEPPPHF
jgi:uncharacterized coiled-coil protein SlyX